MIRTMPSHETQRNVSIAALFLSVSFSVSLVILTLHYIYRETQRQQLEAAKDGIEIVYELPPGTRYPTDTYRKVRR